MLLELLNLFSSVNVPVALHPEANCILSISLLHVMLSSVNYKKFSIPGLFLVHNTWAMLNNCTSQEQLTGQVRNE